jgi:hypothetical protein
MVALRPSPSSSAASDDGTFRESDAPVSFVAPAPRRALLVAARPAPPTHQRQISEGGGNGRAATITVVERSVRRRNFSRTGRAVPFVAPAPPRARWSQRDQLHQPARARFPKRVAMVALRPSPSSSAASDNETFRESDAPFLSLRPHRAGALVAARPAPPASSSTTNSFRKLADSTVASLAPTFYRPGWPCPRANIYRT